MATLDLPARLVALLARPHGSHPRPRHAQLGIPMRLVALLALAVVVAAWPAGAPVTPPPVAAARLASAAPAPETEARSAFADRALATVRVLADEIGSRPAGSDAERRAAAFIAENLSAMGYAVETRAFRFDTRSSAGTSQNVVATAVAEDPALPLVIIGAHYDSVPQSPGGNDNGSGVGTMLEVARELASAPVPGVAVRYVAFGAEEIGLLGSAEYVRQLSATDRARLRVAISIDMMAVGDQPAFGGTDLWVTDAMARAASQGWSPRNQSAALRRLSDHASFLDAGLPAVMFHWVDDPFYHTRLDVSANVQWWSLDLMGAIAIELVRLAALR